MTTKKQAAWWIIAVFLGVLFWSLVAVIARADVGKRHENSVGAVVYQDNPFTYRLGTLVDAFEVNDHEGVVLRIQPTGTYAMFTEDLLFCRYPTDLLRGKVDGQFVLTYKTRAYRMVDGVGCHELVRVDEVVSEKVQ